jgi:DME family drug/metabolite transporter
MIPALPALASAGIWATVSVLYRPYLSGKSLSQVAAVNALRLLFASAFLAPPSLLLGAGAGWGLTALSGALSLAGGDTAYFMAIRDVGASVAAPIAFLYIFLAQLIAYRLGEALGPGRVAASLLIVFAVYILARQGGGTQSSSRARGIAFAFTACLLWAAGQALIKVASTQGSPALSITFTRALAAFALLALGSVAAGQGGRLLAQERLAALALIAIFDLGVGTLLFVYSIAEWGLGASVLMAGASPFLTQLIALATRRESPTRLDLLAGFMVSLALVLAARES